MICDYTFEEKEPLSGKRARSSLVEKALQAKRQFKIFTSAELHQFLTHQEIIHCVQFLQDTLSYSKLLKLYFLLFQVSVRYGDKQQIYNFLQQFEFLQKFNQGCSLNAGKGESIVATKISKFLDSFKAGQCLKIQLNSLINEYHEFRMLENMKEPFITQSCKVVEEYIYYSVNQLITELECTNWKEMDEGDFCKFYQHYCELCTICKRVSYIKCSLFNWPSFCIQPTVRTCIEARNAEINERKSEKLEPNELRTNANIVVPILNVKKKLKAMNSIINEMERKL